MKTSYLILISFLIVFLVHFILITKAQQDKNGPSKEPVVAFETPFMEDVIVKKDIPYKDFKDSTLKLDIYYPPNFNFKNKIPAVVIIFGYTNNAQIKIAGDQFRKWSWYKSWCKIIAASGMAAVVYETVNPESDLISLTNYLNSNQETLMINNLGAYTCSANTPTAISYILNKPNSSFKCVVIYYGFFLTQDFEYLSQIDTLSQKMGFKTPVLVEPNHWKKDVPILIVRAGKDKIPYLNKSILRFYKTALNLNLPFTLVNYPIGLHGFDVYNDNESTRTIIESSINFWKTNLTIK